MNCKNNFPKENRYFETDNGILYCGDCIEIMKEFPEGSIDLVVTSPPYDDLRTYEGGCVWNFEVFKLIAQSLVRLVKFGGVIVWVVGDTTKNFCESLTSFKQAIFFVEEVGVNLLDTMIYVKNNYPPAYPTLRRYANQFEYMFVFSKGKPKTFNPIKVAKKPQPKKGKSSFRQRDGKLKEKIITTKGGSKNATNVWFYTVGSNTTKDKVAFSHPAIFPDLLAHDHIISWSDEDDLILDPMLGSGTVAKQAEKLNRRWIGIEIEEEYCEITRKRLIEL